MTREESLKRAMRKGKAGIELTETERKVLRKAESRLPERLAARKFDHKRLAEEAEVKAMAAK